MTRKTYTLEDLAEAWERGKFDLEIETQWTDADGDCPDEWVARNPYKS